ncbi:hypothetical protein ACFCX4_15185 [Kitasatospora sp. NPDC056327]|uniref:hypothetical protein n=1 Tax=Kitasatospora sp. NPDC056327 TaxID=3345785 RepID=UPI0035E1F1A4
MTQPSREGLERLASFLTEHVGPPCEEGEHACRVEPLQRQVRHAVTGIDAYLTAVETSDGTAKYLHEQALGLWQGLERIARGWTDTPAEPAERAAGTAAPVL